MDAIAEGGNRFAINLYQALKDTSENIVISPISLQLVLALTYCGAKAETAQEIASALHLPHSMDEILKGHQKLLKELNNPVLKLATNMFLDNSFQIEPDFNKISHTYFLSDVKKENFLENPEASRQDINHWVENRTNHRIKDLLPQGVISSMTRLVLVNVIHFKANWANKFDAGDTVDAPFHIDRNQKVTVKMMNKKGAKRFGFKHHDALQAKILEMPYEGGEFRMVLILPDDIEGLSAVEEKLSSLNLADELNSLYPATVDISLPRFTVEETISLNDILKQLGIKSMFSQGADLTGISPEPLSVSEVIQKAFIEVNEEGTEAAAATAAAVMLRMASPPSETFNANHPFIFMITHKKNSVLMIGRMAYLDGESSKILIGSKASSTTTGSSDLSLDDDCKRILQRESIEDVCGPKLRRSC